MKRLFVLLPFFLFIIVGCQNKETLAELDELKTKTELATQNKALIQDYIEAWNTKKIIVIDEFLHSELQVYIPSNSQAPMSLDAYKDWLDGLLQAYPDVHYEILDMVAYEDKVCVRWTCTATYQGSDPDDPIRGKEILGSAIEIFKVQDGKIIEERSEMDALGWNLQIGMELRQKHY